MLNWWQLGLDKRPPPMVKCQYDRYGNTNKGGRDGRKDVREVRQEQGDAALSWPQGQAVVPTVP